MIWIACVEDRMGMMFNKRRVSRDRIVNQDILRLCGGQCLYMEEYTAKLFEKMENGAMPGNIRILTKLPLGESEGKYFFAENPQMIQENLAEKIILYRWNRSYPADRFFPVELSKWELKECDEFAGSSHERVTREIYEKPFHSENIFY